MTIFRVTNSNVNKENSMTIQGSSSMEQALRSSSMEQALRSSSIEQALKASANSFKDTACIIFQDFNNDTRATNNIASISTRNSENDGGNLIFKTNASNNEPMKEHMRVTSSGLVGIGTTEPSQTLDVNGTIRSSSWKARTLLMCDDSLVATSCDITVDQVESMTAQMNVLTTRIGELEAQINALKTSR